MNSLDPWTACKQDVGLLKRCRSRWSGFFAEESRQQIAVSISAMAGSGLLAIAIRFLGILVQGRLVGPEVLGYYAAFTIVPSYLYLLHLGVFTALSRQYPYWVGQGNRDRALAYAANALGWARMLAAVQACIFLIPCAWAVSKGNWGAAAGWGVQSILSVTDRYMMYLASTFRSSSEFVAWSRATVISAVTSLLALPVMVVHPFGGVCTKAVLPNVAATAYAHRRRPLKIRGRLERGTLVDMIRFGAPLMVIGYIATFFWDAVASSYILTQLGRRELGVMTFAISLCTVLTTVASSISSVFLPRIAARYGSTKDNMAASFAYSLKAGLCGTAVVAPLAIGAWVVIDPFVRHLLPAYVSCIPITRQLLWLSLLPVVELPRQMLVFAKHTKAYAISVATGFVLFSSLLAGLHVLNHVTLSTVVTCIVVGKIGVAAVGNLLAWRLACVAPVSAA